MSEKFGNIFLGPLNVPENQLPTKWPFPTHTRPFFVTVVEVNEPRYVCKGGYHGLGVKQLIKQEAIMKNS